MLRKEDGTEFRGEAEIAKEVASYFANLFTSSQPQDCEQIFEGIPRTITKAMNRNLTRPVEDQEITIFSMNPNKAPGPHGMTPIFFQKY